MLESLPHRQRFIMKNSTKFFNQLTALFQKNQIGGRLVLEGSFANETADEYSDIDMSLIVASTNPRGIVSQVSEILKVIDKPIYLLDYGEDEKFPGYYYILVMYETLGPFQIIDLCIRKQTGQPFRGKEQLLYERKIIGSHNNARVSGTKGEKEIALFYMMQ